MKLKAKIALSLVIILIAVLTIAWIEYPNRAFIAIKIPQVKSNIPIISTLSGRVICIDNDKLVLQTPKGDIDIYNYKTINSDISITPKQYITFLTQTDTSYSGKKRHFIIGIITQGKKIFFSKALVYRKHQSFVQYIKPQHLINSLIKEVSILSKNINI